MVEIFLFLATDYTDFADFGVHRQHGSPPTTCGDKCERVVVNEFLY